MGELPVPRRPEAKGEPKESRRKAGCGRFQSSFSFDGGRGISHFFGFLPLSLSLSLFRTGRREEWRRKGTTKKLSVYVWAYGDERGKHVDVDRGGGRGDGVKKSEGKWQSGVRLPFPILFRPFCMCRCEPFCFSAFLFFFVLLFANLRLTRDPPTHSPTSGFPCRPISLMEFQTLTHTSTHTHGGKTGAERRVGVLCARGKLL